LPAKKRPTRQLPPCDPGGRALPVRSEKGQTLRLLDLEGNQAVDTLFYNADSPRERYDAQRTLRRQNNAYLTTGSVLYSNLGNPLLTIVADTCGRHDTLGGACAQKVTPCVTPRQTPYAQLPRQFPVRLPA
jgi:uncharacterized protein YcgI (DUF1989 family)